MGGFGDEFDVGCCKYVEAFAFFEFGDGGGGVGGCEEEIGADCGGPGAGVELVLVGDQGVGGVEVEDLDAVGGVSLESGGRFRSGFGIWGCLSGLRRWVGGAG